MKHTKDLDSYSKLLFKKKHLEFTRDFNWRLFMNNVGFSAWKSFSEAEAMLKLVEHELEEMRDSYAESYLNKTSTNNNNHYAITIGSAEKDDTEPCQALWERFTSSADGKDFVASEAYFEKGDNGYIHIHALIEKTKGWSMSMPKLRKRYGKHKNKQHNFDIKRLNGIGIIKWQNYIKKDSNNTWNKLVNAKLVSI